MKIISSEIINSIDDYIWLEVNDDSLNSSDGWFFYSFFNGSCPDHNINFPQVNLSDFPAFTDLDFDFSNVEFPPDPTDFEDLFNLNNCTFSFGDITNSTEAEVTTALQTSGGLSIEGISKGLKWFNKFSIEFINASYLNI